MSEPRTINLPGSGTDTQSYELAPGLLQYVQAVYVEIDNTAGADARPTLTLAEQSGVVIAKKRQGEPVAAGDTGSATWALRLTDEGGGTNTLGLHWGTNTDATSLGLTLNAQGPVLIDTSGFGYTVTTDGGAISEDTGGNTYNTSTDGGGYTVDTGGGSALFDNADSFTVNAASTVTFNVSSGSLLGNVNGTVFLDQTDASADSNLNFDGQLFIEGDKQISIDAGASGSWDLSLTATGSVELIGSGARVTLDSGGTVIVGVTTIGGSVEVQNHLGNPIFRVNEDGSLQGKTGKALTFNL